MQQRSGLFLLFLLGLVGQSVGYAATAADDEHIRQIVQDLLKEKDQKISQLESRIRQLEQERSSNLATAPAAQKAPSTQTSPPEPPKATVANKSETTVAGKLNALEKKIEELKESAAAGGLVMSGFFDLNAKTGNATDQTFSVGSVELDLDYVHDDHFGASTALVLCGNSSNADFGAPAAIVCGNGGPGGLSGSTAAGIAVALVDYHLFNDRIPPRGRLFNNQGLHIQAGRFDLPFSTDYQYFANKDRITVSAPLTTTRIQMDGFNGDGIRTYGSYGSINYSAFWTDAMYANDGHAIGGRLGVSLGQNTYTIHHQNPGGIEFGVSHLSELDGHYRLRNSVYGADLALGYGMFRLQNEFMLLDAHQQITWDTAGNIVPNSYQSPFGPGQQLAYHSTFIADLDGLIKKPVKVFVRYGRWQPTQHLGLDYDGRTVAINDISMLSLGLNYKFSEHLRLKLEYDDSLGTRTAEHYFDRKMGIAQIVMAF